MSDALQFGLTSASIALFGGLLVFSAVLIAILGRTFPAGLAALVIGFTSFCAYCAGLLGDVKVLGVVVAVSAIVHTIYNFHVHREVETRFRTVMTIVNEVCTFAAVFALFASDSGAGGLLWAPAIIVLAENAIAAFRMYHEGEISWI